MITAREELIEPHPSPDGEAIAAAIFDVETGPLPDEQLRLLCPEFVPPPKPGDFDPASVRCGNLKDKAKIAAKIEEARAIHLAAAAQYDMTIVAAQAEHFEEFKAEAALSAATGRVVAIGLRGCDGKPFIIDCDGDGEEAGLRWFWADTEGCLCQNIPMVGFNIHAFDLPFLVRRSWILGVPIPAGVRQGRYWNPLFIDLMKVWGLDGRELISLDSLARVFGLPGKVSAVDGVEVDGATFYKLWRENRLVAEAYLRRDLELPAILAAKMGVV